jgi:hypothetical protein
VNYAAAQTPTCKSSSSTPAGSQTGITKFKISNANRSTISGVGLTGLSTLEWKYVVLNAVEEWNENANGGFFDYDGTTNLKRSPDENCLPSEKVNLIRISRAADIDDSLCDPNAQRIANWRNTCDGNNWMITICSDNNITANNWSIGALTDTYDLHGILVHELGHAHGLGELRTSDPAPVNVSVMGNSPGSLRKRHLYPWDIECEERLHGRRSQPIKYRRQSHNIQLFSDQVYSMADGYVRGMGNVMNENGVLKYAAVAYDFMYRNSVGFVLSGTTRNFLKQYSTGLMNSFYRELPTRWRTLYNFDTDSTNRFTNVLSTQNVLHYSYPLDFVGLSTVGTMAYCTGDSYSSCNPVNIQSYHAMQTAYDGAASNRTIYAWVNANRTNANGDHNIYMSVGQRGSSENLLNQLYDTGIQSSTNISIACGPIFSANSNYDCILVYVPLTSTTYSLHVRRFYVSGIYDQYTLQFDPVVTTVGWLSGSSPAAWFNGEWFIAHHSGSGIQVRRSSDSTSWSHSQTLDASVGTPRVVSVGESNNRTTRLYYTAQ